MEKFMYNHEKEQRKNKCGNYRELYQKVKLEVPEITYRQFINHIDIAIENIDMDKRRYVLKDYYFYKRDCTWLKWNYGFHTFERLYSMINNGEKAIVKYFKREF